MQRAIAIFDSGVGGLTVAKEIMRQLPQERIIYFGDTARAPYGPRDPKEVREFTEQIVDYLINFNPKVIVIACNTATAAALDYIRERVSVPVIGVIMPGARAAIKRTRTGIIGVIGTNGTINSCAYENALTTLSPNLQIYSLACPTLVPMVERGLFTGPEAEATVREAVEGLLDKPIDCLILGCTHYPFLMDVLSNVMGPDVALISSADETARETSTVLYHTRMLARSTDAPVHHFFCSGEPAIFRQITEEWLKDQLAGLPVVWQVPSFI